VAAKAEDAFRILENDDFETGNRALWNRRIGVRLMTAIKVPRWFVNRKMFATNFYIL